MAEWRQMPHTDGNTFHSDKQTTVELCQLQQPCSQQEQIPERFMTRGIKRNRDFPHDGKATAINRQDAAAP